MSPKLESLLKGAKARTRWWHVLVLGVFGLVEHWFYGFPLELLKEAAQGEQPSWLRKALLFAQQHVWGIAWLVVAAVILWPHRRQVHEHGSAGGGQPSQSTSSATHVGEVPPPCRSGTIYWLGENLARAAHAFVTDDIKAGQLELKNACHHVKHLPSLPRMLPAQLDQLRTRPTVSRDERLGLARDLLVLSRDIGRHVEGWQGDDFRRRDVPVPGGKP